MAEHQELINAMLSISKVLLTAGEETPRYQELVTLVPWNFIAQILNLFLQMFLIKKFLFNTCLLSLCSVRNILRCQHTEDECLHDA